MRSDVSFRNFSDKWKRRILKGRLLDYYAPPGMELKEEKTLFSVGMSLSVLYSLLYYGVRYADQLEKLYWKNGIERSLIPGAVMPDFVEILGEALLGFGIVSALMVAGAVMHYSYHYHESKSIYTMRRLPKTWEIHRRCLTLPLCGMGISLIFAFVCLMIFYMIYMTLTPDICLTPNQWQKLWSVIL